MPSLVERERERGVLGLLAIEHGSDKWLNRIYGETPPLRFVKLQITSQNLSGLDFRLWVSFGNSSENGMETYLSKKN